MVVYLSQQTNEKKTSIMNTQEHTAQNQQWSEGKNEAKASLKHFLSDEMAELKQKISVTMEDIKMFEIYLEDSEGEYNREHIQSRLKHLRAVVVFNDAKLDFFESKMDLV